MQIIPPWDVLPGGANLQQGCLSDSTPVEDEEIQEGTLDETMMLLLAKERNPDGERKGFEASRTEEKVMPTRR